MGISQTELKAEVHKQIAANKGLNFQSVVDDFKNVLQDFARDSNRKQKLQTDMLNKMLKEGTALNQESLDFMEERLDGVTQALSESKTEVLDYFKKGMDDTTNKLEAHTTSQHEHYTAKINAFTQFTYDNMLKNIESRRNEELQKQLEDQHERHAQQLRHLHEQWELKQQIAYQKGQHEVNKLALTHFFKVNDNDVSQRTSPQYITLIYTCPLPASSTSRHQQCCGLHVSNCTWSTYRASYSHSYPN